MQASTIAEAAVFDRRTSLRMGLALGEQAHHLPDWSKCSLRGNINASRWRDCKSVTFMQCMLSVRKPGNDSVFFLRKDLFLQGSLLLGHSQLKQSQSHSASS